MGHNGDAHRMDLKDVLVLLEQMENEYGTKARVSIVPRPGSGYKNGCVVLVTPYTSGGKKHSTVQAEQHLWPSSGHKTVWGLVVYLLHQLSGSLETEQFERIRQEENKEPERMTPLEQYIAKSFQS